MSDASNPRAKKPETGWPSLKEQLANARAIPGSALEKVITANQDTSMLAPSEVNDGLPFPPWLRIWWRRSHPELDFSGPRVGYPLVLKEILEWMVDNQNSPALAASTTLTQGTGSAGTRTGTG
jgi:hypothetical protein